MIPAFQDKPAPRLTYAQRRRAGLIEKKPRKAVKKKSAKRTEWERKYFEQVEKDAQAQQCFRCHVWGTKDTLDRHHTHGRSKEKILIYQYCCRDCHTWIHSFPNAARDAGLLFF